MGHAAYFAGKAHLAHGHQLVGNGPVPVGGGHRQDHRQVRSRLVQPQAADDVDVSVEKAQLHAAPLFRHRQQKRRPVKVEAIRRPPGDVKGRFGHQCLDLRQYRPGTLHDAGHAGAAFPTGAAVQQHLGGVRHLDKAMVSHFKDADFIGGAKAVLGGPQEPIRAVGVPFKIQHAVHHVFQDLGACDIAVLVDVAHHEYRDALGLGQIHQDHGTFLYLGNTAGERVVGVGVEGLDGVGD